MPSRFPTSLAALAFAGVLLPDQGQAQQNTRAQPTRAEIGAQIEFTFDAALLEGRGVRSLRELRGTPVLIEFWGRN